MTIRDNVRAILAEVPPGVRVLAAVKGRTPEEIRQAVDAGIGWLGENYVQQAERHRPGVGRGVEWHFIGHLQKNKVKQAIEIFDMIETVDSLDLAAEISKRSVQINRVMPVLIEVNIGGETSKSGVSPGKVEALAAALFCLPGISLQGLMTIEPAGERPEAGRPYFQEMKRLLERINALGPTRMKYLSMGMTQTYRIAIEEGANIIRIGTGIFGERRATC